MRHSISAVLILSATLGVACNRSSGAGPGGGQTGANGRGAPGGRGGQGVSVKTVRLERMSVQRQVDLAGTLLSPDQPKVSSEVDGVVREVLVEIGSEVRAGDPLVRIEPRELQYALDRAESALRQVDAQLGIDGTQDRQPPPDEEIASVRQAIANRDDARSAWARAEQLNSRGLVSSVDRDTAETRLKVTEANYQAALDTVHAQKASLQDRRASFELARKKLADAAIKAPISGIVSERTVQVGEFIRATTPVATIVQMNPLKMKTAVQEKFAAVVKPGQAVEFIVEAFPGETFKGKIAYVSPAVDQTTRTFAVEALVNNDDHRLKPGFFAKGTATTKLDENVMALTEDAVSTFAGVSSVYVIDDGGKVKQQTVTIGIQQGKLIEIVDGIKGTETFASSNLNQLATGMTIRAAGAGAAADAAPDGGAGAPGGRRGGRGGDGQAGGRGNGQGGRQ